MPQYEKKPDAMPAFVPAMGTFHGRVSREPEEINLQSGSFTKIGLVTDCYEYDYENGSVVTTTWWFSAMLPHGTGRDINKGDVVAVTGNMKHGTYQTRDGDHRNDWTVWASAHKVMQRKAAGGSNGAPRPAGNRRGGRRFQVGGTPPPEPQEAHTGPLQAADGYDDEAPF